MPIVIGIVLVAAGAVLVWGLDAGLSGVDVSTIGVLLIAAGGVGLLASLLLSAKAPRGRMAEPPARDRLASVEVEASPEQDAWESPRRRPEHLR
jgi:hypothetical protein